MTSIELKAHAKVNLFLKVLNKRSDSYHNILTIFERISLCDKVKISKIPEGIVVSSDRFITRHPKDNLAYKAARAILNNKRFNGGVKIRIRKIIPIGGGLGGGSSDAAAVLVGIDRLFNLKLKKKALMKLGGRLGADVPFFLSDAPFAIGRSRGDRLEVIPSKKRFWHLLVYPGFELSTKEVYEAFDRHLPKGLTRKRDGVKIPFSLASSTDFDAVESMLYNDLEDTARSKKDIIDYIIKRLALRLGKKAILSGSGPSLFCLYRTRKEAVKDQG
ncbi:MAG: 4-(cytidine 5'-diphospho)-2-C-methyl-D-erythritol kinase, partial [Candidatus Omnitrophica bacterium]|nr:4-(cytidine 5'-diphospho)-2-C-methyl-D-erythritol kinase [Candidatus Omnitrophota bacterium]